MKVIRTAVLVAAASAAVSKAKEYARENPAKASETIDKAESFVRGKAGPKYADKVGKGSSALRKSLGLSAGSPATASASDVSAPTTAGGASTTAGQSSTTGGQGSTTGGQGSTTAGGASTASPTSASGGSSSATSPGFDPSI